MYAGESEHRRALKQHEPAARSNESVGFLVHDLRNLVNTPIVVFDVLTVEMARLESYRRPSYSAACSDCTAGTLMAWHLLQVAHGHLLPLIRPLNTAPQRN